MNKLLTHLLALVLLILPTFVFADSYYSNGARPGEIITNTAVVQYSIQNTPQPSIEASTSFQVGFPPAVGTLQAFEPYRGFGNSIQFPIQQGAHTQNGTQTGSSVPMGTPVDTSNLPGTTYDIGLINTLRETDLIRQGVPVAFLFTDPSRNADDSQVETIWIVLTDSATGDQETVLFTETGPNTGQFSAWINTSGEDMAWGNGVLETAQGSVITAEYDDGFDASAQVSVQVHVAPPSPQGRIFNTKTNALLDGLTFTLFNAQTGAPATIFTEDMAATLPSTLTSGTQVEDSLGRTFTVPSAGFMFPYLQDGQYRIEFQDNDNFIAPSNATPAELAGRGWMLTNASWLGTFTVQDTDAISFDIPVDPIIQDAFITRDANTDTIALGDAFEYTVTVTTPESGRVTFFDTLPPHVRIIPGTFLVNGVPFEPRISADGRTITYTDLPIEVGTPLIITYGARTTTDDDATTRSTLTPAWGGRSDVHTLKTQDPFGLDDTVILGEVLAGACGEAHDTNRDLSGIRLYLETGEYVLTDENGMFHFRDIARRPHVVQLDTRTLPYGASPVLCHQNTRSAGSAISRFVDVGPGMIGRADFSIVFDQSMLDAQEAQSQDALVTETFVQPLDVFTPEWFETQTFTGPKMLAPSNDYPAVSSAIEIVFVRHQDETPTLYVDGEETRVARKEEVLTKDGSPWVLERWRGVRVKEGRTDIEIVMLDGMGTHLRTEKTDVVFATYGAKMSLVSSTNSLHVGHGERPLVTVQITNHEGHPLRPGTMVQLEIEQPHQFLSMPERTSAPGSQRRATNRVDAIVGRNGEVTVELAPIKDNTPATLLLSSTQRTIALEVPLSTPPQPWILVGLAEGTLAADNVRQHIRPMTSDQNPLSGRVALFAEGTIKGKWLMTLRYDSDHNGDEFYAIDPDKDYIVYGDRSVQGNDAQSRFPLYLRLRSDEAEFLIGDFDIDIETLLISENRRTTGLRGIYETDTFKAMVFISESDQQIVRDRLPLNGTIGPYTLTQSDIVPNSQTVTLVTVSRIDPTLELSSTPLVAGVDYVLDHTSGRLYLKNPEPAFTPNLDRKVLKIDYETDNGLGKTRLAGVRVEGQITHRLTAGATILHGQNVGRDQARVTISGVDITYQIGRHATLQAETVVATKVFSDETVRSRASELRYEYDDETTRAYLRYREQHGDIEMTDTRHNDRIVTMQAGVSHRLSGPEDAPELGRFVEATATHRENITQDERQTRFTATRVTRTETQSVSGGFEHLIEEKDGAEREQTSVIVQGTSQSEDGRMRQSAEIRAGVHASDDNLNNQMAFSFEYDATENVTAFGRFDLTTQSLSNLEERALTFGLKATPWTGFEGLFALSNAHSLSGGNSTNLFVSGTQTWNVGETETFSFGMDANYGLSGQTLSQTAIDNPYVDEDFVAGRFGYKRIEDTWAWGFDIEARDSESEQTANLQIRTDAELDNGWNVGGEMFAGQTKDKPTGTVRNDIEMRFAAAQRRMGREPITLVQVELDHSQAATRQSSAYFSINHNRYVGENDQGELGLRYAARWSQQELSSGTHSNWVQFAGAEYRHDINEKVDFGVQGALMHNAATGTLNESYGLSLGVAPFENGWVSVGYNFTGFKDAQFSQNGWTDKGPFVQFRLKFDQNTVRNMFR